MYISTTGLVLRETDYKETSRILHVLTPDQGILTVTAKGARRKGSKTSLVSQFLTYSEMTLLNSHDRWVLTEGRSLEVFSGLQENVELLSLGAYFADLMEVLCQENEPASQQLSLLLNSLYLLSENQKEPQFVKAVFEMRLMLLSGFFPDTECCAVCGKEQMTAPVWALRDGIFYCRSCERQSDGETALISPASLEALRYIQYAEPKKLFSFSLGEEALNSLSRASERYVAIQTDRASPALAYYKNMIQWNIR